MPNPTRKQIHDAHEALETLCARAPEDTPVYAMKSLILAALPPRPQPTMNEIEWDNEKHYLAEAELKGYGPAIMLWEKTPECITVISDGRVWAAYHEELTPTGKRYTLTEVQE